MSKLRHFIRGSIPYLATILGLAAIAGSQFLQDKAAGDTKEQRRLTRLATSEPLLPSVSALRLLSLGHPEVVADLLWVQTIQYYGTGSPYGNYPSMGKILDTITQLDGKFTQPYELGTIILPYMDQLDGAMSLAKRSEIEVPFGKRGLLDFNHGSLHLLHTKNYPEATRLFELAATQPNHPSAATNLAAVAKAKLPGESNRLAAIAYWVSLAESTQDQKQQEQYLNWATHMQMVLVIERAAAEYDAEYGSYPTKLQQLLDTKKLDSLPISPVGRLFLLDPATKSVNFSKLDPTAGVT